MILRDDLQKRFIEIGVVTNLLPMYPVNQTLISIVCSNVQFCVHAFYPFSSKSNLYDIRYRILINN